MASNLLLLSIFLLLLHITFNSTPSTVVGQCPYPCYPPPTGAGGNTPTPTTLAPPSQPVNYPPPVTIYSPPATVYPYNPPNPIYYGSMPPPPDPIVPWFPYYYKDPPRNPNKSLATDLRRGSTVVVFLIHVMVFQLLFS